MIALILKALGCIAAVVILVVWVVALASWDGKKKHCKPEDCDTCPFPPCRDGHINKNTEKE